eukprot:TRINITY_DN9168_c0_g1_i1.p1 TRINITY_DN9168_c0_g1~~TRINITY_DN9168_c0_g1_i1.p1  ORF type:complete len:138 (+),score=16.62 TRINITY_DN9168_c0_g1_i1:26-415(+)
MQNSSLLQSPFSIDAITNSQYSFFSMVDSDGSILMLPFCGPYITGFPQTFFAANDTNVIFVEGWFCSQVATKCQYGSNGSKPYYGQAIVVSQTGAICFTNPRPKGTTQIRIGSDDWKAMDISQDSITFD